MQKTKILMFVSFLICSITMPLLSQIQFDIETGGVFSGYNDARIPGDGGTLFSLSEELKTDPSVFSRIRVFYNFNPRHHLGILIAPLTVDANGKLDR